MARQATKKQVSSFSQLDCRRLAREHGFKAGHSFVTRLSDGWGYPAAPVVVTMHDDLIDVLVGDLVTQHWPIHITRTKLNHHHASRWWFACPSCTRRCAVIYFRASDAPACRVCLDLAYPSQSQGAMVRGIERNQRIYKKLGWNPVETSAWCRPKGMWRRTFFRLSGQLDNGYGRLRKMIDGSKLYQVPTEYAEAIAATF